MSLGMSEQMEDHLPEILERLKQLDPAQIILFGSHAEGTAFCEFAEEVFQRFESRFATCSPSGKWVM